MSEKQWIYVCEFKAMDENNLEMKEWQKKLIEGEKKDKKKKTSEVWTKCIELSWMTVNWEWKFVGMDWKKKKKNKVFEDLIC